MARIGVFGAGYVGLVTGACFAELGHSVVVRDVVPRKIDELPRDLDPGAGAAPIVVVKSTVPVGTGETVRAALDGRGLSHVGYVSNPEFTAEGTAVCDFMAPDRI